MLDSRLRCGRAALCVVDPHVRAGKRLSTTNRVPQIPFWTTYPHWRHRPTGPALANLLPDLWPGAVRYNGIQLVGPLICDHPVADAAPTQQFRRGPMLVVSPGTVFTRSAAFFRAVIAAFAGSEWTVVLATTHLPVEVLGSLPPNVYAHRWVRQGELVRRADVLLTHGGMSSVQEAILAGTPMVLAPRSREQRRTVRRVCALGGGVRLRADRLRAQVERLAVDPVVRTRLCELQARAAARAGAPLAADMLMDIVAQRRGR
jgi:MGT family glycosyltransferase